MKTDKTNSDVVEAANLTPIFKAGAYALLAALDTLRVISKESGVPMDQITREQIVASMFEESEQSRRFREHISDTSSQSQ